MNKHKAPLLLRFIIWLCRGQWSWMTIYGGKGTEDILAVSLPKKKKYRRKKHE